jgi:hypothetical protein
LPTFALLVTITAAAPGMVVVMVTSIAKDPIQA